MITPTSAVVTMTESYIPVPTVGKYEVEVEREVLVQASLLQSTPPALGLALMLNRLWSWKDRKTSLCC